MVESRCKGKIISLLSWIHVTWFTKVPQEKHSYSTDADFKILGLILTT